MVFLSDKRSYELKHDGYDLSLMEQTQPIGGISFNERTIETGSGFVTCLHAYKFAESVNQLWLAIMTNIPDTVSQIDIATGNKTEVMRSVNRSLNELKDRSQSERHQTDRNDAIDEYRKLEHFASSLTQAGEVIKLVHLRIFIYSHSESELEKKVEEVKQDLENRKHGFTVYQFRTHHEWESLFMNYDQQMELKNVIKSFPPGNVVPATTLGGGSPFHHQSLKDPRGTLLGVTSTQGAFILDVFRSTKTRKSFNGFVLGKMGFGKSTLLKMIEEGLVAKDCYIRGFDKAGDFKKLIESQNGLIIDLAGDTGERINPLEIFATSTDKTGYHHYEFGSYMQHISKVITMIRTLYPSLDDESLSNLRDYLTEFYIEFGLLDPDYNSNRQDIKVTGLAPEEYPIFSDFLNFLKSYEMRNPTSQKKRRLETLITFINEMVYQYGPLFDGHTTIQNLEAEPVLFFDIDGLSQLDKEVMQSQLFNALTIIWSHGLINGRKMKTAYENGEIDLNQLKNFMVLLDECHNIINADNLFAVKYVSNFQREMRKFTAGIFFATQSPAEVLPESANSTAIDEVKKIFSLCQYKILLNLDNAMLGTMRNVLGDTITETEFAELTRLQQGEAIVQVAPGETYKVKFEPTEDQLERFAGGQ